MHKKYLLASLFGLTLFILSPFAFANGGTVPVQKDSGFYVGLQAGYVDTHWGDIDQNAFRNSDVVVERENGGGVRPYIGYATNKYFAVELGWTYLNSAKFSRWNALDFKNVPLTTIDTWAIDLSMRLSLPLRSDAGLFTRVGVAYLVSHDSIKWRANALTPTGAVSIKHDPAVDNYPLLQDGQ